MSTPERFNDLKEVLGDGPDEGRRLRQRARALDAWAQSGRRRTWLIISLGAAAAAAAVAAFAVVSSPQLPAPLVTDGRGHAVELGETLGGETSTRLAFHDGSQVTLAPGSRARIDAADARQLVLTLESGSLEAQVTHGTGRTWRYRAGEWTVRVVGTRLSVRWSAGAGELRVAVQEGAVEVTGPNLPVPRLVRAGESLERGPDRRGAARPGLFDLEGVEEETRPEAPPPEATRSPRAGQARSASAADAGEALTPIEAQQPAWRKLLAQGKRREALLAARNDGVFSRIETLTDADALALGDASRLAGSPDVARLFFAQVLAREGEDAAEAAFLLGRLEADASQFAVAAAHFRQSIARAPASSFAEQSRGRLMEALAALQETQAASEAAQDYLARHPGGAWAGLAQRLVRRDGGP